MSLCAVALLKELLIEIESSIYDSTPLLSHQESSISNMMNLATRKRLTLFSGHDVTLLSLLYVLSSDVLFNDLSYWPDFGKFL